MDFSQSVRALRRLLDHVCYKLGGSCLTLPMGNILINQIHVSAEPSLPGGAFLPEIDIFSALGLTVIMGLAPLLAGIGQSIITRTFDQRWKSVISGMAFGAMIFFLIDLFEGASSLGVDLGIGSPVFQTALVLSFSLGLLIPSILEPAKVSASGPTYEWLAYLFALGIGLHGFAEGVVIGYDLLSGYEFTLSQRALQSLSFVLHKGGEGLAISIPLLYTSSRISKVIIYSGLIGGVPLIVGTGLGFLGLSGVAASYAFAGGAGGVTYMLFRLAGISRLSLGSRSLFLGIFLGVLYMYFSGLIHGIPVL